MLEDQQLLWDYLIYYKLKYIEMKNNFYVVLVFVFFSTVLVSQVNTNENVQEDLTAVKQGDFLTSVFFSYPNWQAFLSESSLRSDFNMVGVAVDKSTIKVGGIAPLGIKMEYMLTEMFGFTFDGIYDSWNAEWQDMFGNSNAVRRERYRFQVGVNYHMNDLNSDRLDVYGGLAIGSNSANFYVKEDVEGSNHDVKVRASSEPFPLSGRVRVGGRYFFNEGIAINFELAIGGPLLSFGVTYRINNSR